MIWLLKSILRKLRYFRWVLGRRKPSDQFGFFKRHRRFEVADQYRCDTLIETGTYLGETVAAGRRRFRRVLSVELSPELYARNRERFASADNVKLWQGDSAHVLPDMLRAADGRALLWLDGHYSGPGTVKGERSPRSSPSSRPSKPPDAAATAF